MSPSRDHADISLARRIADAVTAGDRDEAIRLTRELERALTSTPDPRADVATDYAAARFGQRIETPDASGILQR